jgi:hypothetical protein
VNHLHQQHRVTWSILTTKVNVKNTFTSHIDKNKYFLTFLLKPYLYTFSLYENPSFIIVSARDGIYFEKILVSEYKLFKRSNKANLFIALVQYPVSRIKMTFQEIRIIATGPCIANQLRDVNTICRRSWYIAAHIWNKNYDFKIKVVPFIINFSTELTTVVKFEV